MNAMKTIWRIVWMTALLATSLRAQYSAAKADDANAYDAPVPGFLGPLGDGQAGVGNVSNPIFLNWADTVEDYSPALGVTDDYSDSVNSTGPATASELFDVVSLGDLNQTQIDNGDAPGSLTLSFAEAIMDLAGSDFAVFENGHISSYNQGGAGIGGLWGELAYVEVSSDGVHFARFDSISLTDAAVGPYGSIHSTQVYNLAGKHVNSDGDSWGTPFDLGQLATHPLVLSGDVNLGAIRYIRLVDIPGSGDFLDSLGNPIFDGWWTFGSGGADIDAIGAVSQHLTYAEWDKGRGLDPEGNSDDDFWSNLLEYAFGYDPELAEKTGVRWAMSGGQFALIVPRDERAQDVVIIVEASSDLAEWDTVAELRTTATSTYEPEVAGVSIASRHAQRSLSVLVEYRLLFNLSSAPRFYRIRALTL